MGSFMQNSRLLAKHYRPPIANFSLFQFALSSIGREHLELLYVCVCDLRIIACKKP